MKLVSVLNMSHSGMQLHFYSLTLHELKLISWMSRFSEAPAAGCRLLTVPAQKTFPSFHLIQGLDLIKDVSWTTSATAVQSPIFLLDLHKADGVLAWDSSDSPTFHEHNKDELQHIRKKHTLSHRTRKLFVDCYILIYQQLSLQWVGQQLSLLNFKNSLK